MGSANRQSPSVRPEVNNPGTQQGREANGNDKTKSVASSGPVTLGPRQSAEETAANILSHVQRGLQQLKAGGADAERLQQRLDAAREGIKNTMIQENLQIKSSLQKRSDLSEES